VPSEWARLGGLEQQRLEQVGVFAEGTLQRVLLLVEELAVGAGHRHEDAERRERLAIEGHGRGLRWEGSG
jgi:hypothetical protein